MMLTSEYLSLSWDDLVTQARSSLENGDIEQLKQFDAVLRYRFAVQVRRGTPASRAAFIGHMLRITESAAARQIPPPGEMQRLLCLWEHLEVLMDTLREDGDVADEAERIIRSRKHAGELLEAVAQATGWGLPAGELAAQIDISPQHLTTLLRELEQHGVIERHKAGKHVYVRLALVGRLVHQKRQALRPPLRAVVTPAPSPVAPATPTNGFFDEDAATTGSCRNLRAFFLMEQAA